MTAPTLYIIGTPLGNLNDLTDRAKAKLAELNFLFAEDTRELRKLLALLGIPTGEKNFFSYAAHNMKASTERAIELLHSGQDVGLVTDRGTPCISDPGALLVRRAHELGIGVMPVPGPSSITAALSTSGFQADRFLFVGFLPEHQKDRDELYSLFTKVQMTVCFFESPHRIRKTLCELAGRFPRGEAFLAREMTKVFESYERLRLSDLDIAAIQERGEYTIVLNVGPAEEPARVQWERELELRLLPEKQWAKEIAARYELSSKLVYDSLQKMKKSRL